VDTAIKAIVVLSANDVAVAIAEAIGGTEAISPN
jgi:D-alanyl-D-alanine carboxypeptidase